jgi:hypothetical protein
MALVRQPVLILAGALDAEVPVSHATRLGNVARARKKLSGSYTETVVAPGVNHLLADATTGSVEEYATVAAKSVSTAVSTPVIAWLARTLAAR